MTHNPFHREIHATPSQGLISQAITQHEKTHGQPPRKILVGKHIPLTERFGIPMERNPILHDHQYVLLKTKK